MKTLSVTEFINEINYSLREQGEYIVEGEVSGFKIKDGKWVIFDLKDKDSLVHCFMTAWQLKVELEDGMQVRAKGGATLKNWGMFSFNLKEVQPAGEGALRRAFELLKKKLTDEGLFSEDRKRALPRFPEHIVLITSREAAAYTDFMRLLQKRLGGLTVSFIHTLVQGSGAPEQIVTALNIANTKLRNVDAIALVRGGGSMEDLQAFNDERVVRAVAGSRYPVVVGVGHERDETLCDGAADVRASTPSNAAEVLVRTREDISQAVEVLRYKAVQKIKNEVREKLKQLGGFISLIRSRTRSTQEVMQQLLLRLNSQWGRHKTSVQKMELEIKGIIKFMSKQYTAGVNQKKERVKNIGRLLVSLSPRNALRRGYSITRKKDGKIIKEADRVEAGAVITTQLHAGSLESIVK